MGVSGLDAFGLSALVEAGALRRLTFAGREVVRVIDYPIRDAIWDHACVREMDGRLVVDDESEDDIADRELPSDEMLRVAEEAQKEGR